MERWKDGERRMLIDDGGRIFILFGVILLLFLFLFLVVFLVDGFWLGMWVCELIFGVTGGGMRG